MNKKIFGLALAALSSLSMAATAVVWDRDAEPDMAPAYSFTFDYGTGASIDTTNVNGVKVIDFTAKAGTASNGAGYGFGWKQNPDTWKDVPISLASYKGVCLTYKAEQPFRVDFKQSNITDDNYYGAEIAAAASYKKTFIAFADLAQGWKGTKVVAWSAASQLGVQFGYKNTHAKASSTNTVELASFILADECVTYAPELLEPYKSEVEPAVAVKESEKLSYKMSEMFEDADGDDLAITVSVKNVVAGTIALENAGTTFSLDDELVFVPKANTVGEAIITITATDPTKKSVSYTVVVTTEDEENAPTAVGDAYKVKEDAVLKVDYKTGVLVNDFDVDGDLFTMTKTSDPSHGTLVVDEEDGSFTYTPEADFYGTDSWTYTLTETKEGGLTSKEAIVTIVVENVNDAPTIVVKDSSFIKDTIKVEEDFAEAVTVKIPTTNITFEDPDGDKLTYGVKTNKLINAELTVLGSSYYVELTPVEDANGLASVTLYATDGKDTAGVSFYVDIASVIDPAKANNDSYEVNERDTLVVDAKKGVLVNDKAPEEDASAALVAELETKPLHGSVELDIDGSFTYIPEEGFVGEDTFTYHVLCGKVESAPATVTVTVKDVNDPPKVVVDVATLDTTVEEEFVKNIIYTSKVFGTWFEDPEGDKMTYTAKSDDGKLKVTMNTTTLTLASVKDSIGDAYVTVTATDVNKNASSLKIHVTILNKNDPPRPQFVEDSIYVDTLAASWPYKYDLSKMFIDEDEGDSVTFKINFAHSSMEAEIVGDTLVVTPVNATKLKEGVPYRIIIAAYDVAGDSSLSKVAFFVGEKPSAIKSVVAAPKATWQSAIVASHGTVAIFDMQGRVMWTKTLPASESEVRAVMQKTSGNAILRVNKQTWMLNKKTVK